MKTLSILTTLKTLEALKARLESPAATAWRAKPIAERLQALRMHQTTLEEREQELLPRLQLAEFERERTAADIRMGEAWELAIAASQGCYMRLRQQADRLAKERAATGRSIVALEGRLLAVRRAGVALRAGEAAACVLERATSELRGGDGLPTTTGIPQTRQLEAVHEHGRGADRSPPLAMAASGTMAPDGVSRRREA